jgi:hypothetical protein
MGGPGFTDGLRERLEEWRSGCASETEGQHLAAVIFRRFSGACAADALKEVLESLRKAALEQLAVDYIMGDKWGPIPPGTLTSEDVLRELHQRGFGVSATERAGWVIADPMGVCRTALTLPSREMALFRLALLSVFCAGQTRVLP